MILQPGSLIGQYRIHSLLGEGGMGAVYYGEHVVLGRPAAIKVLHYHIAREASLVHRFVNEARIAAAMNHRNVVDVLDCGMFPAADAPNAQWYIALEFLHGKSLGAFITERNGQPIEFPTILHVLGEAANGLHAAHEKHGLVHRDIKPDNLFLVQAEDDPLRVKILDFGIAKLRQPGSGVQTHSQVAMGTPAYASPEQLRDSKEVDRRADVWALGVIAHEMATGQRPWGAHLSVYEIISHHAQLRKAPDPRTLRPDLPKKWAEVVSKAMEPDVRRRWATARDFARALAEATPMAYSGSGMALLEKVAKELTTASSHSLTVGRPLPPELQLDAAAIATAPERPAAMAPQPMTLSDGVPKTPGTQPIAHGGGPISTIGGSAGQSVAMPESPRRRTPLVVGAAIASAVALTIVIALSLTGGGDEPAKSAGRAAPLDANSQAAVDAAAPTSALAILTTPTGAEVFIDGDSRGKAPLNVQLPVGADVEIRAELAGHVAAIEKIRIGASPATAQLDLTPVVDAGAPIDASTVTVAPPDDKTDRSRRGKKDRSKDSSKPSGKGNEPGVGDGSGSGSSFDPNDVL